MLVLSRKEGQRILIGDQIELTVLATSGNRVRLGIKAPRNLTVDREEVVERKRSEAEQERRQPLLVGLTL